MTLSHSMSFMNNWSSMTPTCSEWIHRLNRQLLLSILLAKPLLVPTFLEKMHGIIVLLISTLLTGSQDKEIQSTTKADANYVVSLVTLHDIVQHLKAVGLCATKILQFQPSFLNATSLLQLNVAASIYVSRHPWLLSDTFPFQLDYGFWSLSSYHQ